MRFLFSLLILCVLISGAFAQTALIDRIEIVQKGVFEISAGDKITEPNAPTGEITETNTAQLIETTDTISAQKGREFGFQYLIIGSPNDAEVSLDIVISYPKEGLKNPDTQQPIFESRYSQTKKIGEINYLGYGFENDWEAVPGIWNFQIWYMGNKLNDTDFIVGK